MNTVLQFIDPAADRWAPAPADEAAPAAAAHRLLTLAQWQAVRATWPSDVAVGVVVPNDADIEDLAQDLPRLALVALQFPKWIDGRAYSQARLLRARLRFRGEVRATGDVVVDMAPLLHRTGFDAVALRAGQRVETAQRALGFFPAGHGHEVGLGYYQGDVLEPRPLFARPSTLLAAEAA
jgi:uncharacterized protein (DUF934 family)